jgi:hypothetical protein
MKRLFLSAIFLMGLVANTHVVYSFQRGGGEKINRPKNPPRDAKTAKRPKKPVAKRKTSRTTSSFAQAKKVRTVTGRLCRDDHSAGPYVGTIYLRVGTKIIDIQHQFKVVPSYEKTTTLTRYINHPDFDKIGSEYVVRYRIIYRQNWAISIRRRGRWKNIKDCLPN